MAEIPHSASLHSEWHRRWQRGDEGGSAALITLILQTKVSFRLEVRNLLKNGFNGILPGQVEIENLNSLLIS